MRGPWENNIAKRTLSDGATVYDWRVRRPRSQGGGFIHGTARALREAKAAKGDVEKQIRDKKYRKPVRQTLNAAGAAWLEAIKPPASKIRPVTWQGYINQFRYLEVHIGDKLVADVTGEDIDKMNAKLLIDGKLRSKGGLSPDSVRHVNVTGHKFYEYEIRKKRVDRNPFKDAEPIGSGRPEHDVWEALELQKFLESVKEDRLFALYRLEAVTGLRRSEIVALPWSAVDFEKKTISIHQTAAYQGQYAVEVLDMVKRDSSRRKVALDDQTITILRDHRKRQLEEQLAWGEIWNNHGLVYVKTGARFIPKPCRAGSMLSSKHQA